MTQDARQKLQQVIDYCNDKWQEVDRAAAEDWPTPDVQTGRKMAYNDVLQHARKLLDGIV